MELHGGVKKGDIERLMYAWAVNCRYMTHVGWYSEQPWYTQTGYRTSNIPLSDEDIEVAEKIGRFMIRIKDTYPSRELCCRYYYGAFPGAEHMKKGERMRYLLNEHGIPKRDVYRERDSAIQMIEGALLLT